MLPELFVVRNDSWKTPWVKKFGVNRNEASATSGLSPRHVSLVEAWLHVEVVFVTETITAAWVIRNLKVENCQHRHCR